MGIKIPEGIPDSTNLLDGIYTFKVESMEPIETSTGKLALKVALRVTKGPNGTTASKGLTHYEQFTIGSNDDPQAREGNTWLSSFGAISLKKMCGKAGVKFAGDVEAVARELEGQKVSGRVVYTVQPKFNKDGTENPYAGNARSQVKDWYEVGAEPAATDASPAKPKAAQAEPKKAPKAPPPPADDDDDDEEEEAPKAKSKSGKASKPAPADDDEDDD